MPWLRQLIGGDVPRLRQLIGRAVSWLRWLVASFTPIGYNSVPSQSVCICGGRTGNGTAFSPCFRFSLSVSCHSGFILTYSSALPSNRTVFVLSRPVVLGHNKNSNYKNGYKFLKNYIKH